MLRKLMIGLAVVAALVVVAGAAILLLVDVDRFKPQIAQFVQDRYQRRLQIDGRLSLSLLPRLALALPSTTLSVPRGEQVAARLAGAQVGVALLPLLRGELVVDTVRIDGLRATIERRADGSLSIDDLIGPARAQPAPATPSPGAPAPRAPAPGNPAPPAPAGALPAFDIGGVVLRDAHLELRDAKADRRLAISDLALSIGRVRDGQRTPVEASFGFASGPLGAAPAAGTAAALTLKADVTPMLADPTRRRVTLSPMRLTAAGQAGTRRFDVALATPASFEIGSGRLALDAIDLSLSIEDPSVAGRTARLALTGKASVDTTQERASASLAGEANGGDARSTIALELAVAGFARPAIDAALRADAIDLDAWLAPPKPPAEPAPAASPPAPGTAGAPPATGVKGAAPTPLPDLSALAAFGLDAKLAIGRLKARNLKAGNLAMTARVADGRLAIAPLTADLYDGRLDARVDVAPLGTAPLGSASGGSASGSPTAPGLRAGIAATLTGVRIDPLLRDLADKDLLEGRGSVTLDLAAAGTTVEALERAIAGTATLRLRDGAVKGINLGERIRDARTLLGRGNAETTGNDRSLKTDFTELAMSWKVADGIATSSDLDAKSPLLRLAGDGRIDVPAARIDYTARVSVVGTAKGQGGRDLDELRGVTIPVVLSGPFAALQWRIDWVAAGRDALKGRLGDELKGRLAPKVDELKERLGSDRGAIEGKARDKVQDALKDLLRR